MCLWLVFAPENHNYITKDLSNKSWNLIGKKFSYKQMSNPPIITTVSTLNAIEQKSIYFKAQITKFNKKTKIKINNKQIIIVVMSRCQKSN